MVTHLISALSIMKVRLRMEQRLSLALQSLLLAMNHTILRMSYLDGEVVSGFATSLTKSYRAYL